MRVLVLTVLLVATGCEQPRQLPAGENTNVPAWAAAAVWYQIFPDRFRNGDPTNDPTRMSLPQDREIPESWRVSEWTGDWYERADWETALDDDFYWTVRLRRYGGDLQGVIDRLDYLQSLGVTAVYFNPLFWARSEHKYDGNTYHHIDPYFGPDPEGDFALMALETSDPATWHTTAADSLFFAMVDGIHERGMRIIIDGVFNHTGRDFFAFADFFENRDASPYREWYTVLQEDDPNTPEDEFDWQGWWGHRPLPEFTDNEAGTDLHPGPKAYVFAATRKWMDPNGDGDPSDGVDGWRLDVVADVPVGFWASWNAHARSINPEVYTVAELWEDASRTIAEGGFSASMNYYGFAFPTKGYLVDGTMAPGDFVDALDDARRAHDPDVAYAVQNLIDSHDTDRVASMIVNARRGLPYARDDWEVWFDFDWGSRNTPNADPDYPIQAPTPDDRAVQRLIALFQMTYVGAPMVYYGTETGMWSADDPDDRQPMWWEDLPNEPMTHDPRVGATEPIPVGYDAEIHDFYREVIALRRSHPSLSRGTFEFVSHDDDAMTVSFSRELEEEAVLVALNRSNQSQVIELRVRDLRLGAGEGLYPTFTTGSEPGILQDENHVVLTLPPLTGAAFVRTGIE